jgi:hypothetical protein
MHIYSALLKLILQCFILIGDFMKRLIIGLFALAGLVPQMAFANPSCDFDGDGMSDFVVVNKGANGNYDWHIFNPRSGSSSTLINGFGNSSSRLIPGNWVDSNQAIAAVVNPVSGGPTGRATWVVKSDDRYSGESYSYTRSLGRNGDIVILGGDYDGNGVTDSLILKRSTGKLGLRVNYFLSNYNGNNLGKERLYRELGRPFVDKNFFFSPDGNTDYLGVIKKSSGKSSSILMLKPFTDNPISLTMGILPAGVQGPLALKQGAGRPDLLAFYVQNKGGTLIIIKDQSGRTINNRQLSGKGAVLVGDYLTGRGYEIAVQGNGVIEIYNPLTKQEVSVTPPRGQLVSCAGNLTIH